MEIREIIGNTTATPNPRPDWAQTDETKADYIKNKPDIYGIIDDANKAVLDEVCETYVNKEEIIDVEHGGTGATTAEGARKNLGITPANIGAVPVGYTEKQILATAAGEMDEKLTAVFDSMSEKCKKIVYVAHNVDESTTIGVGGGNWFFTIYKYSSDYGVIEGESYDFSASNPPRKVIKNKANGKWGSWVNCSPSAFAPAGYGLGTEVAASPNGDANAIVETGFYSASTNIPGSGTWIIQHYNLLKSDDYALQIAESFNLTNIARAERKKIAGTWQAWEWVSPSMSVDTEYRTIERIEGKAVYKKRLESGVIRYRLDGETEWKDYAPVFGAAPAYTYGTEEIVAGSASTEPEGTIHFVYE